VVVQAHHSLARFLSVDRFAAPKTPTFHTADRYQPFKKTAKMKHTILITFILLQTGYLFGQEIPTLEPKLSFELDFSKESIKRFLSNQAFEDCRNLFKKIEQEGRKGTNDYTPEEQKILFYCDETKDNIWQIEGGADSWYDEGGPKNVTASSCLAAQGENTYSAQNADDLSYKTAWVEGVKGYGIGEYLLYTFEGSSPRINTIKVLNGYIKSKTAWLNNSRVKTLKMYVNDQPYAILNLKDFYGEQVFSVKPIGNSERKNLELLKSKLDWTLKFEILDVYKGLKYDDVAITEIYFSGLDVHCFAKGTKVQLADKTSQNIENLKIGDLIAYLDLETKQIKSAKIEKLENVKHHGLLKYKFESGLEITATKNHPFRIEKNIWASLEPDKTKQYEGFENIDKIKVGDIFLTSNGTDKLISIDFLEGEQDTYTISKLSSGNNFIANGLIVGLEKLKD
jgi:hypothetical protein